MEKNTPFIDAKIRWRRSSKMGMKILLASSLMFGMNFAAESAAAHNGEGNWPSHQVRGISCAGAYSSGKGVVRAYTPRSAVAWEGRATDTVFWNPILYRFNGQQYVQWSSMNYPAYAYVTPYGFNPNLKAGWRSSSTNNIISSVAFSNLPPGSYKVLNQIHWASTGMTHAEWGPNACAVK